MITATRNKGLDEILPFISNIVTAIPAAVAREIVEIRIRVGQPVVAECVKYRTVITESVTTLYDIEECIKRLCNYSVHSFKREFKEGFITISGGHRVGFCGKEVIDDNGNISSIKQITSLNIRVARAHVGCAEFLNKYIFSSEFNGMLIIGKPLSGKTTILRDLCRIFGEHEKVSLIDTRSEIAASVEGIPTANVGIFTDVFDGFNKKDGIEIALRSMSPDVIICDEIGANAAEVDKVFNSGVKVVLTAHAANIQEAFYSSNIADILSTGALSHIVLLKGIGCTAEVYGNSNYYQNDKGKDNDNENSYCYCFREHSLSDWHLLCK